MTSEVAGETAGSNAGAPHAQLVAEHRLEEDEAVQTVHDLVVANPRRAFTL